MATLTIAGLALSGDKTSTTGFYFRNPVDWESLTDSKSEVNERPQADGAFGVADDYRSSAAISVDGWYRGADRADALAAKTILKAALGKGVPATAVMDDIDGRRSRVVSIRAVPIDDNRKSRVFTFTIHMIATDPLMYGDTVTFDASPRVSGGGLLFPLGSTATKYWDFGADGTSGRITVTNAGSAPTWPRVRARGGMGEGFIAACRETGQTIEFDRQIPVGSEVTVNQRTGTASIDGETNDVSGFLTSREFFAVPAGATRNIQFTVLGVKTGTPGFSIDIAAAYL
jgi:hypothetical protein